MTSKELNFEKLEKTVNQLKRDFEKFKEIEGHSNEYTKDLSREFEIIKESFDKIDKMRVVEDSRDELRNLVNVLKIQVKKYIETFVKSIQNSDTDRKNLSSVIETHIDLLNKMYISLNEFFEDFYNNVQKDIVSNKEQILLSIQEFVSELNDKIEINEEKIEKNNKNIDKLHQKLDSIETYLISVNTNLEKLNKRDEKNDFKENYIFKKIER